MRYILPVLLAVAVPAAARDLDCETEKRLFPQVGSTSDMRQVIEFAVIVALCSEVKRGPNAGWPFKALLVGYGYTPPDVPGLRTYVRYETARVVGDPRESKKLMPIQGWCDGARRLYGINSIGGIVDGIVDRDGTSAYSECHFQRNCPNTFCQ